MVETSDWRKKMFDNNNFEHQKPFDYELCVSMFEEAGKDLDNLNPWTLIRPIWEITKALKALGTFLSVGFSDITTKCDVWRDILKNHYTQETTIQQVVEKEIQLNIHELNGENNKDKGHKKKTQYYEYVSGTRTLLRLTWFLDFFYNIVNRCITQPDKSFCDCIKLSYDSALAPHHPWLVRKGAGVALAMAPNKREKGMKAFFGRESWDDEIQGKMKRWSAAVEKVWSYLNKYYSDKNLLKLP